MHAAALFAATPKSAGAHAAGALALDLTKPEDAASGDAADAFTQALAGLMGVTAGSTPVIQPTTSDASQASGAGRGAIVSGPSFAATGPAGPATAPAAATETLVEAASPSQAITPATVTSAPAVTVQATTVQTVALQTAALQTIPALAAGPVATPCGPALPSDAQSAAAPSPTAAAAAATPVAFSALSFSVKFAEAVIAPAPSKADATASQATATRATATQATPLQAAAPRGALPQTQSPPPLSEGAPLTSTPIASLILTPDEAAAALPTQALTPLKTSVAASPTKGAAKPDAASAPPAADADPTTAADQPAAATVAPASLPAVADTADRSARSAADAPGPAAGSQSSANSADNASALVTVAAPLTPAPASANLAAVNGSAIVSQIAAQVAKSVEGKSTRFDIALDPAGLGHVDVKVEIGAQGQVTAQLSFDNAHAAAAARSQAGQLQQALEQAGFNISQGGLSFDVGGQGAGFARQDAPAPQPTSAAVQTPDITDASLATVAAVNSPRPLSGVDITI